MAKTIFSADTPEETRNAACALKIAVCSGIAVAERAGSWGLKPLEMAEVLASIAADMIAKEAGNSAVALGKLLAESDDKFRTHSLEAFNVFNAAGLV